MPTRGIETFAMSLRPSGTTDILTMYQSQSIVRNLIAVIHNLDAARASHSLCVHFLPLFPLRTCYQAIFNLVRCDPISSKKRLSRRRRFSDINENISERDVLESTH